MSEPTASQRAEYMIRTLENFIREKRTAQGGMSFRTWQSMAHAELSNAFLEHERTMLKLKQDRLGRRILLVSSSAVVTIGFWGVVMTVNNDLGPLAAAILTGAGAALAFIGGEIVTRKMISQFKDTARKKSFDRIRDFDEQVKKLEKMMWLKQKKTKEEAEKMDLA
jgi:hypothetical protein